MPLSQAILIVFAGVGAGAINAVVGSGTLITFPTLVAMGYPPVTSTMSNAVGLVAGNVSSTWGYRRELRGQWDRLRWQIPASVVGAIVGAWLLLHLAGETVHRVVPVLLIIALILVVIGPRIQSLGAGTGGEGRPLRRRHIAWPDGRIGVEHFRGRRLWRLFHCGAGHSAGRRDGRAAARIGAADERREEPADIARECCCGAGLYVGGFPPDQLGGRPASSRSGSLLGGWLGARYGRRLSPNALRAAIVVVGLIGLYRLLTVCSGQPC